MNKLSPISAIQADTPLAPITSWEELFAQLDSEPGFAPLSAYARKKQSEGQALADFGAEALNAFEITRQSDLLGAVFELSTAEDWNMEQPAIQAAWDLIKGGATAAEAYAAVRPDNLPPPDAHRAWRLATLTFSQTEAAEDGSDEALHRTADTQAALVRTPAPNLAAVATKLEFSAEGMTERGDRLNLEIAQDWVTGPHEWSKRCIGAAYLDLQKFIPDAELQRAWDEQDAELQAVITEHNDIVSACEAAYQRYIDEREVAIPSTAYFYRDGAPLRLLTEADLRPGSEFVASISAMPPSYITELRQTVLSATAVDAELRAKHDIGRTNTDRLDTAWNAAEKSLMALPAPGLAEAAEKLRFIARTLEEHGYPDLYDVNDVARLLSKDDLGAQALVYLHRDLLRLAGLTDPTVRAEAFDPDQWLATFEAIPGHSVDQFGRPSYEEPAAWGPDIPAHHEIAITDPEAIARFDAHDRARWTDEEWEARQRDPNVFKRGDRPLIVGHIPHIQIAYPDGGPEHDRLLDLWNRRLALHNQEPMGAHLWHDLTDWQKALVRQAGKDRAASQAHAPQVLHAAE